MEYNKPIITFLCTLLLSSIISCSSNKPVVIYRQPDIATIYQFERDEIKDLGNGWFEVVGKAIIQNITPEKAEELAIFNACRDAIQYYSGVEIVVKVIDVQAIDKKEVILDHFFSLIKQTTTGIILEKQIIHNKTVIDGVNLVKVVVLKVKVGKQKGVRDPYFNVTAQLNDDTFKEDEKLEITVQSSKNCYITVLNICSNDDVYVIFPNQYRGDNFLKVGEVFKLPNEDGKRMGLSFPLKLLDGKDKDVEMIKILATKKNISFATSRSLSSYGTYRLALKKLLNWLIKIPRNEIEEIDMQYLIKKR